MIASQVCEDTPCELQSADTLLVDGMTGAFHERIFTSSLHHLGQQGIQLDRVGGGMTGWYLLSFDIVAHRGEQSAAKTAINLTEHYDSLSLDNQMKTVTVPVMKTWQDNVWPESVDNVVIGLYQSVDGGEATPVEKDGKPLTVPLTKDKPYNNTAFTGLPTRDTDKKSITYYIQEEHVYTTEEQTEDIKENYVQERGKSDSGIYIMRNREATTLTVNKKWLDVSGNEVTGEDLAKQPDVTFDVYRSTTKISDDIRAGGITADEMATFVSSLEKVRDGQTDEQLTFGSSDDWKTEVTGLVKRSYSGELYYYYILETVPNYGNEIYEVTEATTSDAGEVTIKNTVEPETKPLTVT